MRRVSILTAEWYTTADLSRAIERTPRGARWIADQEQLACQRTLSGQRLFRKADVIRLVEKRAAKRMARVNALRVKRQGVPGEPKQLALFGPTRLSRDE